ncbi:MAG: YihY family inner membrane protein [Gemmatimonadetes bacterium]|nr:YihY family inner membrane protein [Gemmatimonadota bacterium]
MTEPDTRPGAAPPEPADARSLGELLRRLGTDSAALVRHELALARLELRRSARALAGDTARVAIGGAVAAIGALLLLEALVFGLGDLAGRRYWLSSLVLGVLLAIVGGVLLATALKHARSRSIAPTETIGTLRETGEWARAEAAGIRATLAADGDGRSTVVHRPASPSPALPRSEARGVPAEDEGSLISKPLWKRVYAKYQADDVPNQAAKVAYYFFMSLPPLLMAGFGMAGLFGGDRAADRMTVRLQQNLPAEASALVSGFVDEVVRRNHPGLLSLGLLLALWSGSSVFTALEDSLNAAWGIESARGFLKRRAVALGTLLAVGLLFLAGSTALLAGPAIAKALRLGIVWTVLQWPLGLALVVAAFWIVYYVLPNADQRESKVTLVKASALAAGLWLLATIGFRLYAANFGSYSKSYGVLGGIIVLLLWMYYTSTVILVGGEVASEMEGGRSGRR